VEVKRLRLEKKVPEILSLTEVHLVLNLLQNLKHRMMLQVMYTAGLRRSELLNLKPKDIDSANGCIMVRQGKGKKDRKTLLSIKVLEELRVYYKIFRPSVYLFEPSGKKGIKMSPRTLEYIVKDVVAKAGIKKDVSCHTFRHSFATHLLDQGTSLKVIQELLGHTSIRTTSIYLHLSSGSITRIASPFDSL
jgi:integrase/recombinase XerD